MTWTSASSLPDGPLSGIRIVEFGANLTVPYATMLLADQGADVIKVEHGLGDQMRYSSSYRTGVQGLATIFITANRNKRSLLVDLKDAASVDMVRNLVRTADVVVQNFRPGVIDRLGFGYDTIRKLRSDIVYVSVDGLGTTGPECERRVYDTVIQGMSGMAGAQCDPVSGRPDIIRTAAADKATALVVSQAITAGLLAVARGGEGQHVRVSMIDAGLTFMWPDSMGKNTLVGEDVVELKTMADARIVFKTKDDYILATSMADADWLELITALERADLANDPRFSSITLRIKNVSEVYEVLSDAFLNRTTAEWLERLRPTGAIFAPITRPEQVHLQPQIKAIGAILELDHPQAGRYRQPRHPVQFEGTPTRLRMHAPRLGEHNGEIEEELAAARARA